MRQRATADRLSEKIPRRRQDGPSPLSFAQQRLWFLDRLTPDNAAYNLPFAVRLEGQLEVAELEAAILEVVSRHQVLRSRFSTVGGQPRQQPAAMAEVGLARVDLGRLTEAAGDRELARRLNDEASRPFDLQAELPFRACLVELRKHHHVVLFTLHHIAADGWSMGNLSAEVAALYGALVAGEESDLTALEVQYSDYAAWQRETLEGEVLQAQLDYWRQCLSGAPQVLELPTDRPRPATQSLRGSFRKLQLGTDLAVALEGLAQASEVTSFMLLMAAFQTLLSRYCGQTDLVVGSPVANRGRPELEPLIGYFVNNLALRSDLSGNPVFADLLASTKTSVLAAFDHQEVPFEKLIDEFGLERSLSYPPLFQVVFALQAAAPEPIAIPGGLRMSAIDLDSYSAKFELTLSMQRSKDGFHGGLEYATDLFDSTTVDRLLGAFANLLRGLVKQSRARLWELPLLSASECWQVRTEWSGGGLDLVPRNNLIDCFAARVANGPERLAVACGRRSLSYGELDRRSTELAAELVERGALPGQRIALCVERDVELAVGILGILKAGCAYLPIDSKLPAERLRFLLEDAAAELVVADRAASTAALPTSVVAPVRVDRLTAAKVTDWRPVSVPPEAPAYVIYTSGSTGRPKGVVVSHANVLRLFDASERWFNFDASDVWTLFHSYSFDFSVWEFWGALLYGGRLEVVPYSVSRSPADFRALLTERGVTVLNQTPSAFRQLIQADEQVGGTAALRLRWVIFGGEALEPRSLAGWVERHGDGHSDGGVVGRRGPRLINMYGITETTVHVTYRRLTRREIELGFGSVIGVPIPDLQTLVLDHRGGLVPIGVAGELQIAGGGVASGYLHRAALTAMRFVPDPYSRKAGSRLYRSGDLGRWSGRGELEYLGRIDLQVKVRGFRIELGEIEAALAAHARVAEAVVVARREGGERQRLVAYVVGDEQLPSVGELRSFLADSLPEHMLPAHIVALAAMPLTANGKLDRGALPAPSEERPDLVAEYIEPRTAAEAVLCRVWAEVLGIEKVGINDNFFALGGDSILSLRAVALAGEAGVPVALPDLFRFQTVAELGEKIGDALEQFEERPATAPFSLLSEAQRAALPDDVVDAYPLTYLQSGMLFHMELTPEEPLYHNVDSWHLRGRFEFAPFRLAVDRVVARHPILRTSFDLEAAEEPLQRVHRQARLPISVIDFRGLPSDLQELRIQSFLGQQKRCLLDFSRPPQLRFYIHLRSAETFQFTLIENHAILDGWSLHSTLAEMFELFFALLDGDDPAIEPPLSLTFREFVERERQALESQETIDYWQRQLADLTLPELPSWPLDAVFEAPRIRSHEVPLEAALFDRLVALQRIAGVPIKSIFLSAHLKVLSLTTGRHEVFTGLASNGRLEEAEGDQVRGLFLNLPPLRLRLQGGSWVQLARQVFAAETELLPHRLYPQAALQRQFGQRALVDISFNYMHFHVIGELLLSDRVEVLDSTNLGGTNFKLTANFAQNMEGSQAGLILEYDSQALPPAQAAAIGELYGKVLAAMAGEPGGSHQMLDYLRPSDRHRLLVELNDTGSDYEDQLSVPQLFAQQVDARPDAIAIGAGSTQLSYGELDRRARRIAHQLIDLGVELEDPVGVCLRRSPELIVALLAVVKAGGVYIALDPEYPVERLRLMIEDTAMAVLVTASDLSERLPSGAAQLLLIDRAEHGTSAAVRRSSPLIDALPVEGLCLLIYTSGSTGQPKASGTTHRGVVSLVRGGSHYAELLPTDTMLQQAPVSFDASVLEIWGMLLNGGRVGIGSADQLDLDEVATALIAQRVTVQVLTSGLFRLLAEERLDSLAGLRDLMTGGEAASVPHMRKVLRAYPRLRLSNVYGPSENSTYSAVQMTRPWHLGAASMPIGTPVSNRTVLVLDGFLRLVASGVPGRLYVGGHGLARGYWRRPGMTASVFVPHPYSRQRGERLYDTGDLARLLADGSLDFLGRQDHQVKIRGFRIEPGEVAVALMELPEVGDAVVVVSQGDTEKHLVAYVVPTAPVADLERCLHAALATKLPTYMLPSAIVELASLPLSPNGKLDREALPAPRSRNLASPLVRLPESAAEKLLAEIWQEVLVVDGLGVDENFFELGGHSLLATRVISRLRRSLNIELPLSALFEEPTIGGLARLLERDTQNALGASRRIERRAAGQEQAPSFGQRRLWFIDQLKPGNPVYNIANALRLEGQVDSAVLVYSIERLVERHQVLRTVFHEIDGQPVLEVRPPGTLTLPEIDLSGLPTASQWPVVRELAAGEASAPFDLGSDSVLRVTLLRLAADDQVLLLVVHHIAADGWSMDLMIHEISAHYSAAAAGQQAPLPELPIQYADFAAWQQELLSSAVGEQQLQFWHRTLDQAPALLELPLDRPRPAVQRHRGARYDFQVPAALSAALRDLGQQLGATPFMILLTAFKVLLARHSGQSDISIGTPIAGRRMSEAENLIGLFANTLVLRNTLQPANSFSSLVAAIRATTLDAYENQDLPFERLVEELKPERSLAFSPLFQVFFVWLDAAVGGQPAAVEALRWSSVETGHTTSMFDLALTMHERQGAFVGEFVFDTDLFEASTVQRLAERFRVLLDSAVARPGMLIAELSLLPGAEVEQLLLQLAPGAPPVGTRPRFLHQFFGCQAALTPAAVAVVHGDRHWTYAELDQRATEIAAGLQARGVGPEVLVAVCVERGAELVAALLGVLKAGGGYLPLDSAYPTSRLRATLQDSRATLLLVDDEATAKRLEGTVQWLLVSTVVADPDRWLAMDLDPDQLAYSIYTSGSTGRPKGIGITHGSAAQLVAWASAEFSAAELEAVLASTSVCFDLSVFEIFVPLSVGGRVVMVSDALELAEGGAGATVTLINSVPSAISELNRLEAIPPTVRTLNLAGEPLRGELLRSLYEGSSVERVLNLYGPSEDTTYSTWAQPLRASSEEPPIGRPISGSSVFLLDPLGQLVPIGVVGELLLAGAGLARGYLGRPALTAERFVPDGVSGRSSARMYRSGDLARWRVNGELEFLGRLDHQVKVRGFRIELGEIEVALSEVGGVDSMVVVAEGSAEARRLVAYVTGRLEVEELRRQLSRRLPAYMVPEVFVVLEALPLNVNGKIDRDCLPSPAAELVARGMVSRLPESPTELRLAAIWQEVLELGEVGAEESFFTLGGHSLLATRVISRVRTEFAAELPLRSLFETPTIAGLARQVDLARQPTTLPALRPLLRGGPLPLSFAQQRLWFIDQLEPGNLVFNIPIVLHAEGPLEVAALAACFTEVVRRHEVLRTTFATEDGEPVQVVARPRPVSLPLIDLCALRAADRQQQTDRATDLCERRPFNLATGPLVRCALIRMEQGQHQLQVTLHHIVSDAWTLEVLYQEVAALYHAFSQRQPSPLAELPLQYADYAGWQRQWLRGEALEQRLDFWRHTLAGAPPLLELPYDRPRPAMQSHRGGYHRFTLSQQVAATVGKLGQSLTATPFIILLALFKGLLARYSGAIDLVVGTPVAGRDHLELERLIGCFINTLVLRTDLSGDPSSRQLVQRVREVFLAADAHQQVPFEKLVEELGVERSLTHSPLFQVMFLQPRSALVSSSPNEAETRPDASREELSWRVVERAGETSQFDLTLSVQEDAAGGLVGTLEYCLDLFEPSTMERLARHYSNWVAGALADPELTLSQLSMLSPVERYQLRFERALGGSTGSVPWSTVQQGIWQQARCAPQRLALVADDVQLSYAELVGAAARLGERLRLLGVGPEVAVALSVERSPEMVVAVLAVLAAGGFYVPLDPALPTARCEWIVDQARPRVLLTRAALRQRFAVGEAEVLLLDDVLSAPAAAGDATVAELPLPAAGESAVYAIFTSGSTGRPKGVLVSHQSLANYTAVASQVFVVSAEDRVLQLASLSFDASAEEIFPALTRGATLVLRDEAMMGSARAFFAACRRQRVTVLDLPTALWHELMQAMEEEDLTLPGTLRLVILGGEAAQSEPWAIWRRRVGSRVRLVNTYGPTESTIVATHWQLGRRAWLASDGEMPMGRPVAGCATYLAGRRLQLVPPGVDGELLIGGRGVARCYLGQPALTAERFVPNPFSDRPGDRLYRSGDLARWRSDGALRFIGRLDQQIKIRGFRVELGEIENVLAAHPQVREAALRMFEDPRGARLVAYVVGTAKATDLRQFLAARLPDYMVPAQFVDLERLPLNTMGKLDRQALPQPRPVDGVGSGYSAPRGAIEQGLAEIWQDVLGVEQVGRSDDFFALGGHSLLATRVIARLRRLLGVEPPLRLLFEAPVLAQQAASLGEFGGRAQAPPIEPQSRDQPLVVSFAQQRLWLIDQLDPGSAAYNMPIAMRVEGELDIAALGWALSEMMRRHEVLRSRFVGVKGVARQRVDPPPPPFLPLIDLSGLTGADRRCSTLGRVAEEAATPFDLARGPLLRALVLRLAEQQHAILITVHHIVSDGWSMELMSREMIALYGAGSNGRPSPLAELPIQYGDFAIWQRRWLAGEVMDAELAYWRRQLAGAPPVLELPLDRPRPALQSSAGAHFGCRLDADTGSAVRRLARELGATPFMVMLAAYGGLLARHSNQLDLCIGTPVAGRGRLELEPLIGFFVNTLVLRADCSGDPSGALLVERTKEAVLAADQHQNVPFDKLVEELAVERSLSTSPLFQVMFALQNAALEAPRPALPGNEPNRWEALELPGQSAQFDLTLTVFDGDDMAVDIEYRSSLFDPTTIERMAGHYRNLVRALLVAPQRSWSLLTMLSAAERCQLMVELQGPEGASDEGSLVHQRFQAQARRCPEAVAVVHAGGELTYAELAQASAELATCLCQQGVGPEVAVALVVERGPEMIVAVLGIAEAGGFYVPIDPSLPAERQAFMLDEVRPSVLVTQSHLRPDLPPHGATIVLLDPPTAEQERRVAGRVIGRLDPENPAYTIYTSGSTGRPKGVVIRHGALAEYIETTVEKYGLRPGDRVLQFSSVSFDASVEEIYSPLVCGATLVLRDEDMLSSVAAFLDRCERWRLTVLILTTAYWHELAVALDREDLELPPLVRLLAIGGEAALAEAWSSWSRRVDPRVRLINLWGTTETTISTTQWQVRGLPSHGTSEMPIGRPLRNYRTYLCGRYLEPVPLGVSGEALIGGSGLARGFFGRPRLTAQRFIPDPFACLSGSRLYRTGDLARWTPDGVLEFAGRIDLQVKVRGFRVELGEIESVLMSHPAVREAAVTLRDEVAGDQRLVAYLTGAAATAEELRAHLADRLPAYMVPVAFVALEQLPQTALGKVDRRALPAPARKDLTAGLFVPPCGAMETAIASIWQEVLAVERVGRDDNFFALGGHSLLAARVISRLRQALGVEPPLRAIFESPTLADLAVSLEQLSADAGERIGRQQPGASQPLSYAQRRLWLIDQLEPGSAAYNIPTALRIEGQFEITVLSRGLTEVVRRHQVLRTRFESLGGIPQQVIEAAMAVALPLVELSALRPAERAAEEARWLAAEADQPFDLGRAPLLRGLVLRLAPECHAVALSVHHIASDGWSMELLTQEVSELYRAFAAGRPSPLEELQIQYADFAAWQRQQQSAEDLEAELSYWQERLAAAPPPLELPFDRPRPAIQSGRGAHSDRALAAPISRAVRRLAEAGEATLFIALLSGFQAFLGRLTGQLDFTVGTPVAGRDRLETEPLIGFFVNTLVLRADLTQQPNWEELLRRTRQRTLEALDHQTLPFEKLVEVLDPQRSLAYAPLFQVMFQLNSTAVAKPEVLDEVAAEAADGPRWSLLGAASSSTKFDLTLAVSELDEGLHLTLEYSTDLFEKTTIDRLLRGYEILLEGLAMEPELPFWQLPLLSPSERRQLLEEWSGAAAAVPEVEPLSVLFAARVQQFPQRLAVIDEYGSLSYRQLDQRAEQLAAYLRQLGAGAEVRVGLLSERSLDMVVALLAIAKTGSAYVPLDPAHPPARLVFVLADAAATIVVGEDGLLEGLELPPSVRHLVGFDSAKSALAGRSTVAVPAPYELESTAYVIYTSGSTGQPKGTMISQRSLSNYLLWAVAAYGAEQGGGSLVASSLAFDLTITSLLVPLISGTGVRLISAAAGALGLGEKLLEAADLSLLKLTPSQAQLIARQRSGAELEGRARCLVLGGEALSAEHFATWPSATRVVNEYGPTEATVGCILFETRPTVAEGAVPIGRPVAGARAHLLDRHASLVAPGVAGELYLGGPGLARGYVGRPALTAERFVPDPFTERPGERLYRSGDLARYLAAGELDFLGRCDQQIKLRGYRIEPGEIEALLAARPGVEEAFVMLEQNGERLLAYVAAGGEPPKAEELRQQLASRLPEYMVPSVIVVLPALPLTVNGKIDRRALPPPVAAPDADAALPAGQLEQLLAKIFAAVLGLDEVGREESFFALGGHSLLATQVVSRIRAAMAVELPLRELFEQPTVAGLAARVELAMADNLGLTAPPLVPAARDQPLPLSFTQRRLWFIDQLDTGSAAYNLPHVLRLRGELDVSALAWAFSTLVRRHEILRTSFGTEDEQPVQRVSPAAEWRLPRVDLGSLEVADGEHQARRLARQEGQRPFDLSRGPLLRTVLLDLAEEQHLLLVTMHHIASDAWSMQILSGEVGQLYQAAAARQPDSLPPLPIQYADYAVWQRQWLAGEVLEQMLETWTGKLRGAPRRLDLPFDRPRPEVPSLRGGSQPFVLPAALAGELRGLGAAADCTLFMTLLACLYALLYRLTGQPDLVVGTDLANRNRAETEGLIGFFVNILPLRLDLSGGLSFRQLLTRVRLETLSALTHQDLPFDQLVMALSPERSLAPSPLFDVLFVNQTEGRTPVAESSEGAGEAAEPPSLTFEPMVPEFAVSRFELALFVGEDGGTIAGAWDFQLDLFDPSTIATLSSRFETLIASIVALPDAPIDALEYHTAAERLEQDMQRQQRQAKSFSKFKKIKPKAVSLTSDAELVATSYLSEDSRLPVVFQPTQPDVDLVEWAAAHRQQIEDRVRRHGAALFRGFGGPSVERFERFAVAVCPDLYGDYGDLPKEESGDNIYHSTPYPKDKMILFHNESSHLERWPIRQFFSCVVASTSGGETPIVDCRQLYRHLDPVLRQRFEEQGLRYVRNFTPGLDVSWQDFLKTEDRQQAEHQMAARGLGFEWKEGGGLRIWKRAPAIVQHPDTGTALFFNQIQLHHVAYLDEEVRSSLLALYAVEDLPRNVYFGDGSPIEDEVAQAILELYWRHSVSFRWQEGDIVMLDNMLIAHARNPFEGERKIIVAMGRMFAQEDLTSTAVGERS